jgi:uncharacterized membrane protein
MSQQVQATDSGRVGRAATTRPASSGPHDSVPETFANTAARHDRAETAMRDPSSPLQKILTLGATAAPYLIATPMAIFGVQHFIYLQFVSDFMPPWIPWRTFWAMFTGVALFAAATGIVLKIYDRWAATLLGSMIFAWVVILHTWRIAVKPQDFGEWRGIFQALALSGCAFALVRTGSLATKIAPFFVGIGITALGFEHFIFANVAIPQVPVWIPGSIIGNYLTGMALILAGVGLCFSKTRWWAGMLLASLILLSLVLIHVPIELQSTRFNSDWTKTLALTGGAFRLASTDRLRGGAVNPALCSL